jgi:hypothetical protein
MQRPAERFRIGTRKRIDRCKCGASGLRSQAAPSSNARTQWRSRRRVRSDTACTCTPARLRTHAVGQAISGTDPQRLRC